MRNRGAIRAKHVAQINLHSHRPSLHEELEIVKANFLEITTMASTQKRSQLLYSVLAGLLHDRGRQMLRGIQ